jgi:zinc transporter, ZIP family
VAMVVLILAAAATTLATGLGAIPVFYMGTRAAVLGPSLWALAAGAMAVASVAGLLIPAGEQGSVLDVAAGALAGVLLVLGARRWLAHENRHGHTIRTRSERSSILVFGTLLVHSLPEGFAIGTAYASDVSGLSLFVILAIGLQNVPEGTSVALPMAEAGFSRTRQFWAAVLSSAPQPPGAVIAYLAVEQVRALLPISLAFAGGAMLTLVLIEMAPRALERGVSPAVAAGFAIGAAVMLGLSLALGV